MKKEYSKTLRRLGLNYRINRVGSMFTLFFTGCDVTDYDTEKTSNRKLFARYFQEMLKQGIYLLPSQFEAAFISVAHTENNIERTVAATLTSLEEINR